MIEKLERKLRRERDGGFTISEPVSIGEMHEKINELVDAVNELQKHLKNKKTESAMFAPERMNEIRQKMKIPVVTDESAQNLLSENIELKAENLRLRQDLNRVCNTKFEELDATVRKSNETLFNENQKLKTALERTRKALDVAKDTIIHADWFFDGDYNVDGKTMHNEIKCAIKGITALEQKDVK